MVRLGRPKMFSKRLRVPNFKLEKGLRKQGFQAIAGVDEVGRGAWAGPLYAAAVILPERRLYKIRDSKLLQREEREELAERIKQEAVDYGYGRVEVKELAKKGMHQGTLLAFQRALKQLGQLDYILTDHYQLKFFDRPQLSLTKGDQECLSIAAASILAKAKRDRVMVELSRKYSQYDFANNKGYPSPNHQDALKRVGPCSAHRTNFAPIKQLLSVFDR